MQGLQDHFLLAMPHLDDEQFAGTVSYLCDHDDKGTLGLIINQPLALTLKGLFDQLELGGEGSRHADLTVFYGGPVHKDRGFILHRGQAADWDSSLQVTPDIALTTSMDILHALAEDRGPDEVLVCLGCAGWESNQLAQELKDNTWLTVEATPDILFHAPPAERLELAARSLGVDLSLLSREAGHG
ncbi:YqgE/AlgH family protein [Larsenimonas rhizosphaerae]|uniref:YqgE/AlgH family protein n=1 Tax=Larsenimonas rhizosphaerae TaxID=2944682 RepID=UPI0020344C61|nr:YqgE/AlgH family protein [Larsenimonas rhizosphaerae]MCM2129345.1 YqgE/AlgH family protein [Larsenimonas rhizosphaerae]